jgi:hypothetical protein
MREITEQLANLQENLDAHYPPVSPQEAQSRAVVSAAATPTQRGTPRWAIAMAFTAGFAVLILAGVAVLVLQSASTPTPSATANQPSEANGPTMTPAGDSTGPAVAPDQDPASADQATTTPPVAVTVPNVVGHGDWREADEVLGSVGLELVVACDTVPVESGGEDVPGAIASQDPPAGAEVVSGSQVTVMFFDHPEGNVVVCWQDTGHKPLGTWTTYSTDQGLSSSCVRDIAIDPDGVVWLACEYGVSSYDGSSWSTYLTAMEFGAITVAPDGSVWAAAMSGGLYHFVDSVWEHHDVGMATDVAVSEDGTVWVLQDSFEPLLSITGDVWAPVEFGDPVADLVGGPDDSAWVFASDAVLLDANGAELDRLGIGESLIAGGLAPDGTVWTVKWDGLWAGVEPIVGLRGAEILDLAFAPDGSVWIASDLGAFRYEGTGWARYTERDGLTISNLEKVAVAPDGIVWLASSSEGVAQFVPSVG